MIRLLFIAAALTAHTASAQTSIAAPRAARVPPSAETTPSPAQVELDAFQMAIVKRDVARIAAIVRSGRPLDVNFDSISRGRTSQSPLSMAAQLGHADIVRTLLDGGADPNRRDGWGRAPIHAVRTAEIATLLVKAGADPNALDGTGRTAAVSAVERGDIKTLDALIAVGGRLDVPLRNSDILSRALEFRQPQMVRVLLERGLDVRALPPAAIIRMIDSGDEETAKLLIARGANPDAQGPYGEPLLVRALFRQRWAVADALIDAGASVKLADPSGCAAGAAFGCLSIQLARLASVNPPMLARIVDKGLDLDTVAASGHTALSSLVVEQTFAVRALAATPGQPVREIPPPDNVAKAAALLKSGASPNHKYRGMTPLMLAIGQAPGFVGILLDHGGTIEYEAVIPKPASEQQGAIPVVNTMGVHTGMRIGPLTWAALHQREDVALRLLQRGKAVTRADRDLAYFAAATGQWELLRAALVFRADPNAADRADVTPLMLAAEKGDVATVRALLAAGARINARSAREWPPLLEMNPLMLLGGHPPSRPHLVGGYTALRAARERGHAEVVRLLTEAGGRD